MPVVEDETSAPNIPTRHNNPLNIKYGEATRHWVEEGQAELGEAAQDGGHFLRFQTPEAGFTAARELLFGPNYSNLTVDQALRQWSNQGYGAEASGGLPADTRISQLSPGQQASLIASMAGREGFHGNAAAPGENEYDALLPSPSRAPERNEYDALLGQSDAPLRASLMAAQQTTPDRHAQVLKLSDKTLLPPEIVERNFDQLQQKDEIESTDYDRMLRDTPKLAEWIRDPNNAKVSRDDIDQLSNLEALLNLGKSFAVGGIKGAGDIVMGMGNLFETTSRSVDRVIAALGIPNPKVSVPWWLYPPDILRAPGRTIQSGAGSLSLLVPPEQQGVGTEIAVSLGEMVPLLAAAMVAPEAEPAVFAGQALAGMHAGEGAQRMAEKGVAGTAEGDIGLIAGAGVGILAGEFGIEKLLERVPPKLKNIFLQKLADVTLSGGYQAAVGVVMDLANNIATKLTVDPNQPLIGDLLHQAAIGGATGAIARAVLGVAVPRLGGQFQRMEAAQRSKGLFEALGQGVTGSKTFQRLPEKLQDFVRSATKDGPIANVYIPAEEAQQYFQDKNLDPSEVLGPEGAKRYQEALQANEDIQVPLEDYATRIAPSEHAGFFNDLVRLGNPEAMNAREADAFAEQARAEHTQQNMERADQDERLDTSAQKVGEDIRGQMTGIGFPSNVVDAYAKVYEQGFRSMAERSGQDPFALYDPYRLKITRPLPEILRSLPDVDTQLDPLIDRLRAGKTPTGEEMFGKSLTDFLREKGGLKDEGGELASREPDANRKPFDKRLINKKGLALDRARELAAEAGYLPKESSVPEFLDAIDKELRGQLSHAPGQQNAQAIEQNVLLGQLSQYLKSRDVDIRTASNAEIKKVLKEAATTPVIDAVSGQLLAQKVFHGSPHIFDEFSLQKIGTGEGAQAYGWGLYFAGSKEVADYYRKNIGRPPLLGPNALTHAMEAKQLAESQGLTGDEARAFAIAHLNRQAATSSMGRYSVTRDYYDAANYYDQLTGPHPKGRLYQVEIPEDADYLDWDKPISQQPPEVKAVLKQLGFEDRRYFTGGEGFFNRTEAEARANQLRAQFAQSDPNNFDVVEGEPDVSTGQDVYHELSRRNWIAEKYGTDAYGDRAASKTLREAGIPGIKYLDYGSRAAGEGTSNYVLFDDRLAKITSYEQAGSDLNLDKRGTIHFGPNREFSISLLQNADLSTFLHETGHFYLEVFGDIVDDLRQRGELKPQQQQMVADYDTALKWLGVESREGIGTEHHEQFARGFEAYLREGKAPAPELRPIFQRFKAWLTNIYRSLTQLNVHLNDDVRGVFDRLLASDEEITRAREDANIREMIENQGQAERLGLSPEEFRAYGDTVRQARDRAKDALDRQYLDELNKKQSDWYQARTKTVRDQIAAEVHGQRDYMALSFLKDGTLPDGSPLPEGVESAKLDASALEARYGKYKDSSIVQQLKKLNLYRREGGIDPDQAADLFGYSSGDEMIQALLKLRPMDDLIEAETTDRMRQSYGDMLTDGTAPQKARDAVMTEGRSKVLEAEMQALAKKVRETEPFRNLGARQAKRADRQNRAAGLADIKRFVPSRALARDIANARIAEMRVRDIGPGLYYSGARREGNAALEAVNRGDFQEALKHKQNELVQVELYRAAIETQKEVETIRDKMRSFDDPKKRGRIGKAGEGYLDQIDKLRERFEFSQQTNKALDKRASLADFIKSEESQGHELAIPPELQNEARQQNYRDMTVEQLRGLHDAVTTIEHAANFKNKLLRQAAQRDMNQLGADGQASIEKNRKGPPRAIPINPDLPGKDPARVLRWMDLGHRPLQSILRELDGYQDGFFFENVYRPAAEARDAEGVMGREADQQYGLLYDEAFKGNEAALHQTTFIPELGKPIDKTMALAVALNSGNEGNLERLHTAGIGNVGPLQDVQIRAITDTLDAKDWKFVQGVAELINSYKDQIGTLYKRVTGVAPEWVEPKPFQTKFGQMPGWYYPIMYSGKASARALPGPEASFADIVTKSSYMRFQTANGHTEARTQTTGIPLRGDLGVIGHHLQQVIHDLTHREMLTDVGRILGRKDIQDAIYKNYGDQYYRSIQSAFRDVAIGPTPPPDWYRSTFAVLRRNYGMARLAWNFGTIVRHITNITNGMVRVGPVDVTKEIFQRMGTAKGEEYSRQWILENSDLMRSRWNHRLEETATIGNDVRQNRGKWSAFMRDEAQKLGIDPDVTHHIADTFLYGIHKVIEKAEIPTWSAAYRKAVEAGRSHEDARASADAAITDAFGGGDVVDLPSVQRDYVGKLFSTFMQYGLSLYRQNYEIIHKAAPLTRKAVDAMLINIVPTVMLSGIFAAAYGKKYWDELKNEQFDHFMSQNVFAREVMGALRSPDYQGPAAFGPVGVMKRLINQTYRAIEAESGDKAWKAFQTGLEAGGEVSGIPAPQIEKSMEGLWQLWEGKTRNPEVLLFGPPPKK